MPVSSILLYNVAFVFMYFHLIHLEEKFRGMLMQMLRRKVEYQVGILCAEWHMHLLKLC